MDLYDLLLGVHEWKVGSFISCGWYTDATVRPLNKTLISNPILSPGHCTSSYRRPKMTHCATACDVVTYARDYVFC